MSEYPLIVAVRAGSSELTRVLLADSLIDVNAVEGMYGFTAIAWASMTRRTDLLELLMAHPKIKLASNHAGDSLLHYPAQVGFPEVVELLLTDSRIDLGAKDENGRTALDLATASKCREPAVCAALINAKMLAETADPAIATLDDGDESSKE
jgi:ankyrin repeat protein